ncbi:MAG: AMIN domain-containing protein [Elusimicrobia bacterium]|nr:AMIN domain-containing protein [Elusimicrobiota bacterium]
MIIYYFAVIAVFFHFPGSLAASQEETWKAATKLSGVRIDGRKILLQTEGAKAKYKTFAIASPPKIVVEFYDAWLPAGFTDHLSPDAGESTPIEKVRVAQFARVPQHIARVVVDLAESLSYQTSQLNGTIALELGSNSAEGSDVNNKAKPAIFVPAPPPVPGQQGSGKTTETISKKSQKSSNNETDRETAQDASRDILRNLPITPVDINFQDVDIKTVMAILIEKLESLTDKRFNLLTAPDVTGTITLKLEQVPFNEAFQTILSMRQMVANQIGSNIIQVMGQTSYLAEKQRAITQTRIFVLNYITASEMKTHLDSIRSLEGRKGNILIANDINALIVTDTDEGLIQTARFIKELDVKPKAVSIEAKIIDLQLDKAMATISLPLGAVAQQTMGITFGRVTNTTFLTSALSLAAREGKLKVLSNPRIVTLNNQLATINAGQQIPTVQTTVSPGVGTTQSASYLTVGVTLSVRPTITSDRHVKMLITPTVSQLGSTGGLAGVAPAINQRTATTNLIVKDNETAVIGGLILETKDRQTIKVPILGDLPIIGWFFRKTSRNDPRSELLVFVTPKIID